MAEEIESFGSMKKNEENKQNQPFLKIKHSISFSTNDDCCSQNMSFSQQLSQSCFSALNISDIAIPEFEQQIKSQSQKGEIEADYQKVFNYKLMQIIGKGAFSTVYKAIFLPLSKQIAVKIINFNDFEESLKGEVINHYEKQVELLALLQKKSSYKFTSHFYTSFISEGCGYIVMDFLQGFTLQELIQSEIQLTCQEQQFYLASLVLALQEMQQNIECVHRDIKPENIMIVSNGEVVLLDFGCAKLLKKGQRTTTINGTCQYYSPSRFRCDYGFEADFWSFGVTAYELVTKELPFCYNGMQYSQQQQKFIKLSSILKKQKSIKLKQMDDDNAEFQQMMHDIFNSMLSPSQDKNYLQIIKQSLYFKQYDWQLHKKNKIKPPRTFTLIEISEIKQASAQIYDDF